MSNEIGHPSVGGQRQKKNALYAGLLLKITWRQPPDLLRSSNRNRKRLIRDSNRVKTLCEGVERHGSNQNQPLRVAFFGVQLVTELDSGRSSGRAPHENGY